MSTPYMGLVLPTVSVTPGPEYATENNTAFETIDAHDHTTGKGKPIVSTAININADLEFNSHNATELRSTRYDSQSAALATGSDVGCFYNLSGNPAWNDNSGTASRVINTTYPFVAGDLLYASSTTAFTRLGVGSNGQVLKLSGGLPSWASSSASLATTTVTTTYTIGANDDIVLANPNSASFTATLPVSTGSGKQYFIKYVTSTDLTKVVTIARAGSDVIVDSGSSVTSTTLNTIGEEIHIVDSSAGTWQILSRRIPSIWTSYSLTIGATSAAPTPGTNTASAYWKRQGDSVLIRYNFTQTVAGSAGTGSYLFPPPSGVTFDTTINTASTSNVRGTNGTGFVSNTSDGASNTSIPVWTMLYDSGNIILYSQGSSGTNIQSTLSAVGSTNIPLNNTNVQIYFLATVPVSGWNG